MQSDQREETRKAMSDLQMQKDPGLDAALLERCRSNDAEACGVLLAKYNRKIFNTAYRILGEHASAEDAVQETLINVYKGLAKFRGDSQVSTWISRITVNVCLGMIRKGKARQNVSLEDELVRVLPAEPSRYNNPEKHAVSVEQRELVAQAFSRMSAKHRTVVQLHDLQEYTIPEIAQLIACPVGTVKSRLFYGRQEFRDLYSSLSSARPPAARPTIH